MANFPTTFSEQHVPLTPADMGAQGRNSISRLESLGLQMVSGLLESDIPEILAIADTEAVKEFCPNDLSRFGNPEKWLSKGRGAFLLRTIDTEKIVGYSWVGMEECHELPDNPTTTAFRTTVRGTGADFVTATVEAARAVHDASHLGLETWASNVKAVKTYPRTGAQLVVSKDREVNKETGLEERIHRPTFKPEKHDFQVDDVWRRYDVRLFMAFPEK